MAKFAEFNHMGDDDRICVNVDQVRIVRPGADGGTKIVFEDENSVWVKENFDKVMKQLER